MIRVVAISFSVILSCVTMGSAQEFRFPATFGLGTVTPPKAKVVYGTPEPVKYTPPAESLGFVETLFSKEGCGFRLGKTLFRCTLPTGRK